MRSTNIGEFWDWIGLTWMQKTRNDNLRQCLDIEATLLERIVQLRPELVRPGRYPGFNHYDRRHYGTSASCSSTKHIESLIEFIIPLSHFLPLGYIRSGSYALDYGAFSKANQNATLPREHSRLDTLFSLHLWSPQSLPCLKCSTKNFHLGEFARAIDRLRYGLMASVT